MQRSFVVEDEPTFYLGTTRPWMVGFIDKDYDKRTWSNPMQLVLDSCYPINRPEKLWATEDYFNAQYGYKQKMPNSLDLSGQYTIRTTKKTMRSKLEIENKIKLPFDVDFNKKFGIVVGVDFARGKTEAMAAIWNPKKKEWKFRSFKLWKEFENGQIKPILDYLA